MTTQSAQASQSTGDDLLRFLRDELVQLDLMPPAIPERTPFSFQVERDRFGMVITFVAEAHPAARHYLEMAFSPPTFEDGTTSIFRAQGRGVTAMLNCNGDTANLILLVARDPAIIAEATERIGEAMQQVVYDDLAETLRDAAEVIRDFEALNGQDMDD